MQRTTTLPSKLFAIVLSLALVVSFTGVGNLAQAQAAENDKTATLTIVAGTTTDYTTYTTSYNVWLNQEYAFTEGQTMADLLATAKTAGGIKDYSGNDSQYGFYLTSITSASGATIDSWNSTDYSVSMYWSVYVDGKYSSVGMSSIKLEAGHKYQLAYNAVRYGENYSTVAEISAPVDWNTFYDNGSDDQQPAAKKAVKTFTVNAKTVTAKAVKAAAKKAGATTKTATSITLGKKVKTIKTGAFKSFKKVKTLTVKTKKLTKKSVKKALKGSKVKTVKVKIGSKKTNKKYVKAYKKIFTKKIAGKKAAVK